MLNTIPLPRRFTAQLVDHRSRARLGAAVAAANVRLLDLARQHPEVVVIDVDPLLAEGIPAIDPRMSVYAKGAPVAGAAGGVRRRVDHLARHLLGATKKVLAVDFGRHPVGAASSATTAWPASRSPTHTAARRSSPFQRTVKQIAAQSVLLAAVSKNDADLVREALRDEPGMVLREDDFVQVVANWRPKHDNLTELAEVLNLHVDSVVFVDDSPYECGLVRRRHPGWRWCRSTTSRGSRRGAAARRLVRRAGGDRGGPRARRDVPRRVGA